ncbi:uncharacterized protein LOC122300279 [Carya illinoinensis]|uniref:uncharacterized protein LOC122300279 n=1 Tax=Carya illinoinensis TaxID=32201 RepID=UPI001C71F5BC|nr:uncharacterized protein LOC122300279 [Carya illinoinensis]
MPEGYKYVTLVYAKCNYQERRRLWSALEDTNTNNLPWIVVGDFNIIRYDYERRGGKPRNAMAMEEFNHTIDICGIMEMPFSGPSLSWCNGHSNYTRSWARLDRIFFNASGCNQFHEAHVKYLPRTSSDHAPMLFSLVWEREVLGSPLSRLVVKHKSLKSALRIWNKQIFGRTEANIARLELRIEEIEKNLQRNYSADEERDLFVSQLELKT